MYIFINTLISFANIPVREDGETKKHTNLAHSKLLLPLRILVGRHLQVRHLHIDLLRRRHLWEIVSLFQYFWMNLLHLWMILVLADNLHLLLQSRHQEPLG